MEKRSDKRSALLVRRQLREVALAAGEKKAADPVLLDLRKLAGFSDYFYICSGSNQRQIEVISEAIELRLEQRFGLRPSRREGGQNADWIVLDYLDFIAHVFSQRSRAFYGLERLWSKARKLPLPAGLE